MDTKKITIGVLVIVTLIFGFMAFKNPSVVTVTKTDVQTVQVPALGGNQPAPVVNVTTPTPVVNVNVPKTVTQTAPTLGALASPDLPYPWFSVGGVRLWAYSQDTMNPTGSTTCSFLSPSATTTLVKATANISHLATSTAVEIGMASTRYATTTIISQTNQTVLTTGGTVVASSTAGQLVIPPSQYINTKIGSNDVEGTTDPLGTCKLVLMEM